MLSFPRKFECPYKMAANRVDVTARRKARITKTPNRSCFFVFVFGFLFCFWCAWEGVEGTGVRCTVLCERGLGGTRCACEVLRGQTKG